MERKMPRWSTPLKLAAEVINDALRCGLDCAQTPTRLSMSAAEETDNSARRYFPRPRLHPKLIRRSLLDLHEAPAPAEEDTSSVSSDSTDAPPKSSNMWQPSEPGKTSARSSTAFRDSITLREDSELPAGEPGDAGLTARLPETPTDRRRHKPRRQRSVHEQPPQLEPENLPKLLHTLNKYIKKIEKQRLLLTQLRRENEAYRETIATSEFRILQNLENIDELQHRCRRMDDFVRRRQLDVVVLGEKHKHMDHDLAVIEELFTRQRQALVMLKAHVLRVYHADASSGSGETTLQNLCMAVMQILSEVNEF
eukprot:Gregarina_sp_Pseudo_9__1091@NODE_1711_length_1378_cov_18_943241_g1586_i0_p1_GENE_NODE_1711_length_1378_cov_18_943241_g1586_i0NODE_1711_length_1378_cov_18_943241_g1586_i0_p1_ORF_typecomplete_len310_score59_35SPATA24/PF15175_6/0_0032HAUS5/PF14817_6/0_0032DUF4763/PF15960_5/0_037Spc7/PF08317_11/0_054EzrA/PF06160_12/0_076MIPT3_C/PF17749_1/3_5MIPT3_C/PF17749_1/1_2e02NHR2/PF08788_11/4_7NHR2/PF08788_11/1_1e03NHR2/PF08788_11/43_NODE_1711_length_1378_cov_18_943241_g1586_i01631092